MFRNAGGHTIQNITLMDFGQGLHGIVLFLRLEGSLEQLFDGFPSVLNGSLPLGFELVALAGERDLRLCVGMLLTGCTQKAHPDKNEDFLLRLRKRGNILLFRIGIRASILPKSSHVTIKRYQNTSSNQLSLSNVSLVHMLSLSILLGIIKYLRFELYQLLQYVKRYPVGPSYRHTCNYAHIIHCALPPLKSCSLKE